MKHQFIFNYLFGGFQSKFKHIIQKDPIYNSDWEQPGFSEFNTALILDLEPRYIPQDTVIFKEGDKILESVFVLTGSFKIGYRIGNNNISYKIELGSNLEFFQVGLNDIGAYYAFFSLDSDYYYKSIDAINSLIIRKRPIMKLH